MNCVSTTMHNNYIPFIELKKIPKNQKDKEYEKVHKTKIIMYNTNR